MLPHVCVLPCVLLSPGMSSQWWLHQVWSRQIICWLFNGSTMNYGLFGSWPMLGKLIDHSPFELGLFHWSVMLYSTHFLHSSIFSRPDGKRWWFVGDQLMSTSPRDQMSSWLAGFYLAVLRLVHSRCTQPCRLQPATFTSTKKVVFSPRSIYLLVGSQIA